MKGEGGGVILVGLEQVPISTGSVVDEILDLVARLHGLVAVGTEDHFGGLATVV
jgi:hypothetical protein